MSRLSVLPVLAVSFSMVLALEACATRSALPDSAGFGAAPALPAPQPQAVPTVKIARAVGWPQGQTPAPAAGLAVNAFATGLDHPRWLHVLPNGDVLVAESQAPAKPKDKKGGLRGWVEGLVMSRAGSGDTPSADRISLLRDADGDGTAETKTVFLSGLTSPFGMALIGGRLYVANADAVVMVPYQTGQTRIDATPAKVADLPAGRNHHWTKSLVASADGSRLYVGVGSNSNIGENGLDEEVDRAAILEIDVATGARRVFASGLRNPVGLAWNPQDGRLWTSVNERDALGDDLVPDYMTSVTPGGFYGWPWSYYGQNVDERVQPARPGMVARAIRPDYALGSHTASLGLTFYAGTLLPQWRNGAIIGQHGSWNRNPPSGYKVIFVPFRDGRPDGPPQDVLTGFRNARGEAMGRPVGVVVNGRGALLVADDVGDAVWRVTPAAR
ncbi:MULTISPECIES: PQQ-dependent sugar dehydrogenase [Brevundimonas]|jgi:glucose/arabinose dehydrogenase|uniref:PQQ-dependent sugar dehydrogenase n=1 Tax=Brevundimonas TaxID=41275 RepID=UPI0019080DAA|nr:MULTISPECIES: sorbosone dehydrogenase family protein [Brevundimonas]MBK1969772.1 sorbosone dehydrogenase family protein [Brevundimonas diminuta]MBK1976787.1 sorbosone dehydrogenase family protein [Brevundimonas diminuta]MDA1322406.1 sorbosone dehydrogenase family protein [Pseudomonadota bacterium]MDM8353937.1 sorbosone dehydrogenase family protein [Brevundimonas diminuta]